MKLIDLINEYNGNGFVMTDKGNGSSKPENGQFVHLDDDLIKQYGQTEMNIMDEFHMSDDGVECMFESDWIVVGDGDNPYRVKIFF